LRGHYCKLRSRTNGGAPRKEQTSNPL